MAVAVLATGLLRAALPPQLRAGDSRWLYLAVIAVLLVVLIVGDPGRIDRDKRWLRVTTITLIGLISLANATAAVRLVVGILDHPVPASPNNANILLVSGGAIWLTNVIAFGALVLGRGPRRGRPPGPAVPAARPAFVFPEMVNSQHVGAGLVPEVRRLPPPLLRTPPPPSARPTCRPSRPWAKLMMMAEEAISLVVAILVVARAVNILN